LKQLSWRVDVKTASRFIPESNIPIAMFELNSENGVNSNNETTLRFEMNRTHIADMLSQLESIEKAIDSASS
jgi:hypothetical protein